MGTGRALVAAVVVAVGLCAAGIAGSARFDRTTFANGVWSGSGRIEGGIFGTITENGTGTVSFRITVCNGHGVGGALVFSEHVVGRLQGYPFTGDVHGVLPVHLVEHPLIQVRGPVTVTAHYRGLTTHTTVSGSGKIEGHGTVTRMTGDLAVEARSAQSAAGFGTDVTANFVARRVATRPC